MAVTTADVQEIVFDRAPLGSRGYHEVEVEQFLDRLAKALDGDGDMSADEVHAISFSKAPLGKRGYDRAAVDAFLRLVESTLAGRQRATSATTSGAYIAPALEHSHARKRVWHRARR